jgi:hypothetical protein
MRTLLVPLALLGFVTCDAPLGAQPASDAQSGANPGAKLPQPPALGDPLFAPIATPGPQSLSERFMDYAVLAFGPRALVAPLFPAALRMIDAPNAYPRAWKDGAGAFGRNYGDFLATQTTRETGRFVTAALLHEDFRYRPSRSKNALARGFHALAFTFVDKSDSGHDRIAVANFAGAGAAGFVGNLYLPAGFNNASHAETRVAIAFGTFAGQNLLREFAPDLAKITHKLHLPRFRNPVPEWWVKR